MHKRVLPAALAVKKDRGRSFCDHAKPTKHKQPKAIRQRQYRARVAEGVRCYKIYLNESQADKVIAEAEWLLDPKDAANARVLAEIRIISKSDYTTPEERYAFVDRVFERWLLAKIGK